METIELSAPGGVRLDKLIADGTELSRSAAVKLIEQGNVLVNGSPAGKKDIPAAGSAVEITLPEPQSTDILPENIPLDIVYEDDDLLVVNKPKGMVVHPAAGHYSGTLVNALLWHCKGSLSGIGGEIRPGIVHRIDKDTSGLLIVAKTDRAHRGLAEQIASHSFGRRYDAVLVGTPREERGTVDAPVGRHPTDRKRMAVNVKNGKRAVTDYAVTEHFCGYSLVECRLHTGRTHQIRVHMASIGHPVLGDPVYCPDARRAERFGLHGQCLHAKYIEFTHPATGERLHFTAEPPAYFRRVIDALRSL